MNNTTGRRTCRGRRCRCCRANDELLLQRRDLLGDGAKRITNGIVCRVLDVDVVQIRFVVREQCGVLARVDTTPSSMKWKLAIVLLCTR